MEWNPISTAPRDGTNILIYYRADGIIYDATFDADNYSEWVSSDYEITNFMQSDITHWMPLPYPPEATP